jgi:hypothetical protein
MNVAQVFHADLDTPAQLVVFFATAAVTAAVLTVWSAITRTVQAVVTRMRGQR